MSASSNDCAKSISPLIARQFLPRRPDRYWYCHFDYGRSDWQGQICDQRAVCASGRSAPLRSHMCAGAYCPTRSFDSSNCALQRRGGDLANIRNPLASRSLFYAACEMRVLSTDPPLKSSAAYRAPARATGFAVALPHNRHWQIRAARRRQGQSGQSCKRLPYQLNIVPSSSRATGR